MHKLCGEDAAHRLLKTRLNILVRLNMSIRKCKKQSVHGQDRIKERCHISDDTNIKAFIKSASIHGYNPEDFEQGPLRCYIYTKKYVRYKRIKVYKGVIFVFNRTSNRLITAYNIPDKFVEEFNEFVKCRTYPNTIKKK